jgi:hypothetical protein
MSIGNTKTDGNKGNNFPYQIKVLQGLQCTCDELKAIGANTSAIEAIINSISSDIANVALNTTGVERTPGFIRVTDPGDLSAFAPLYSLSIANVGLADGLVLSSIIKPGEVLNFSADALNNFFTSFVYDGTGTELIIIYVS